MPQKSGLRTLFKSPKLNRNMKRKSSAHSVSSETQSPRPAKEAIDYRVTGTFGRRSLLRKMGITGASLILMIALLVASSPTADDIFLKFKGGIGVIPVSSVAPPGQPWVIRALIAEVDGRIHVEGRDLLLAGGNGIGTNGGQKVFATLICGTAIFST